MLTILLLDLFVANGRREVQPSFLSGLGDLSVLAGPIDFTSAVGLELLILLCNLLDQILSTLL